MTEYIKYKFKAPPKGRGQPLGLTIDAEAGTDSECVLAEWMYHQFVAIRDGNVPADFQLRIMAPYIPNFAPYDRSKVSIEEQWSKDLKVWLDGLNAKQLTWLKMRGCEVA
jgi:hypothetical protein